MSDRSQRGQATVELALLLPVLVLLAAVLVQVAVFATNNVRLWHAAREAVRVASVDDDPGAIRDAAAHAGLSPITVRVDTAPEERVQGEPLTVDVTYRPASSVPLIGRLFDSVVLEARATMRIEQP